MTLKKKTSTRKELYRDAIKNALLANYGSASLAEIYEYIKRNNPEVCNIETWQDSTRRTIYKYSSYSEIYHPINEDLFYSLGGKSSGKWGLRNFSNPPQFPGFTYDDDSFPEGKEKLKIHLTRERNPAVIKQAKIKFKEKNNNKLFCQCCNFNFFEKYGEIGTDFIEGHHIRPVSQMRENEETKIQDIILLCSNCHSMIHRKRPWIGIEDLKSLIIN